MIRVACTGGRHYSDVDKVFKILDKMLFVRKDFEIVVGDATGADALVRKWCKFRNVPVEIFYADWTNYGAAAGPIRNKEMLKSGIDFLVAFPGGKGTKNMVSICKKAGVCVLEVS
jgi:hypothetical protein